MKSKPIGVSRAIAFQEEDMWGVDAFIDWAKGEINHEIRRIAWLTPDAGEVIDIEALGEKEDFLTGL